MTDKKRANQKASPQTSRANNTSTEAQRARLRAWLKQGPIDTITARWELNIIAPAARIKELRVAGRPIKTQGITLLGDQDRTHSGMALYFLSAESIGRREE